MINKIWAFFIIIGILFSLITGGIEKVNMEIINSTKTSMELILKIVPLMCLWLGIMNIAKESGLISKLASKLSPLLSFLFPEIPKGDESLEYISSNVVVNVLGLGSAATPFGLKAMESLQKKNKNKVEATRSMITFLILNTSGLTLVPTTVISLRMLYGSSNPTEVILPVIIATVCSTILAILIDKLFASVKR